MASVATAWEAAARNLYAEHTVVLRAGIVLDRDTPALDRLVALTRWGLGGRIGRGQQWISWIHILDLLAIAGWALHRDVDGVLVASSPHPVRNADFIAGLRHALHRPATLPTPEFAVRLGALALRTDPALALTGRRAAPRRLTEAGFSFACPELAEALGDLTGSRCADQLSSGSS